VMSWNPAELGAAYCLHHQGRELSDLLPDCTTTLPRRQHSSWSQHLSISRRKAVENLDPIYRRLKTVEINGDDLASASCAVCLRKEHVNSRYVVKLGPAQ
jgi:hypothetical protein